VLALILTSWVGARAMLWESPLASAANEVDRAAAGVADARPASLLAPPPAATGQRQPFDIDQRLRASAQSIPKGPPRAADARTPAAPSVAPLAWPQPVADQLHQPRETAAGHQLLWMAAMAHLPMPRALEDRLVTAPGPERLQPSAARTDERWALDAWGFWRSGRVIAPLTQGRLPIYGASQAGAVLSYRLSPANPRDPKAYARAYRALLRDGETELALGLSARPVGWLPLRAHAELRATDTPTGTHLRPAALVTSELAPIALPARMRTEIYLQGGYVAGKQATAFADGQAHVLRDLAQFDLGKVSAGVGAWGGAQRGAHRVDLGPSARVDFTLGSVPARASIDWRERVAGDAAPRSGVAATLSTRF